jgi:hypothetical protein
LEEATGDEAQGNKLTRDIVGLEQILPFLGSAAARGGPRVPRIARGAQRYVKVGDKEFVSRGDGKIDFGHVSEDVAEIARSAGLKAPGEGPIRLEKGWDDPTLGAKARRGEPVNDGMGEAHIERRHGEEIRSLLGPNGNPVYADVADLVSDVAENYNRIARGHSGRIVLGKANGKEKVAIIELAPESDHYTVITAGLRKKGWLNNLSRRLPWGRTD